MVLPAYLPTPLLMNFNGKAVNRIDFLFFPPEKISVSNVNTERLRKSKKRSYAALGYVILSMDGSYLFVIALILYFR